MVLLGKVFHGRDESLYVSFKGSIMRFVYLVDGGSHRASEYHTTLCLGSGSTASTTMKLFFPTDDAN